MDVPFRVEVDRGQRYPLVDCWAIKRNCETLCTTNDVTFAYRMVELLNRDQRDQLTPEV